MNEQLDTVLRLARQAGFKFHSGFLNGETRSLPLCLSELEYFYHLALEDERKKEDEKADLHICKLQSPYDEITYCNESKAGTLWVSSDVAGGVSQVNFCPACGYKAKIAIGESK